MSVPPSAAAVPAPTEGRIAALGLAIILVGQPVAWSVRGFVGDGVNPLYPIAAVLFGLLLLVRRSWFHDPRLYVSAPLAVAMILLWLLPVAALSLVAPVEVGNDGAYALFLAAVALAVAMTPLAALRDLPETMTLVGGISSVLPLVNLLFGHAAAKFVRLTLAGSDNQAITGSVGGATMIAALLVVLTNRRPGIAVGLATSLAFVAGLGCVVLSNTRSVMLMLLICLPLIVLVVVPRMRAGASAGLPRAGGGQRAAFWTVLGLALVAAPAGAAAVFSRTAIETIGKLFTDRILGAFAAFDDKRFQVLDESSQIRVHILDYTIRRLDLLGHGISEQIRSGFGYYPHLTYLQAFYDFGVFGGLLYLQLGLVLPFALIYRRLRSGPLDPAAAFVMLYFIYGLGDQFSHSTPYSWSGLIPAVLVFAVVARSPLAVGPGVTAAASGRPPGPASPAPA